MSVFRTRLVQFVSVCLFSIRRTLPAHLPLYICAVLFTAATAAIDYTYKAPLTFEASLFFLTTVPLFMLVGLFIAALVQFIRLARAGSQSPLREFGDWAYRSATSHDRPGNIVHSVITITPLMVSFSALKEIIPLIQPFTWDVTFEQWDRLLGFGHAPWELLQPIIGYPIATMIFDIAYSSWFIVIFAVLIWQAFFAAAGLTRMQYLLAFSLCWFIAGNILAVAFASVGPCYYGFLHSPDPYATQLAYLRETSREWPVLAVQIQDRLWASYVETKGVNLGISAMPSMHVAAAVVTALVARRSGKWLGALLTIYSAMIVIGSVHLAWHYAVDGIAGIALAILFWHVAGVLVRANASSPILEPGYPSARAGEI
jgi:PAP2 superfamily